MNNVSQQLTTINLLTNSSSNFLNFKLTNFGEVVNKAIKEGTNPNNNKINQVISNNNQKENNVNNVHPPLHTSSGTSFSSGGHFSELNFNKTQPQNKTQNVNKNYVYDLAQFFQENNLNFQNFYEFLKYLKEYFLKDGGSDIRYNFLLISANKAVSINRIPITMYETSFQPKKYFIIIEGDMNGINSFNEDRKYIIENIQKNMYDDSKELAVIINKKITEINELIG